MRHTPSDLGSIHSSVLLHVLRSAGQALRRAILARHTPPLAAAPRGIAASTAHAFSRIAAALRAGTGLITVFAALIATCHAICAMGQMPMEAAPQAAEDAGLKIPNAGFDISSQIAQNIKSGRSIATVDQQPFYQGLLTVLQLYYHRKYGLHPCDVNTGGATVDASNVEQVMELANTVR